jgi:hypothetical protein
MLEKAFNAYSHPKANHSRFELGYLPEKKKYLAMVRKMNQQF